MKKMLLIIMLISCNGCAWLIPGAIKREASLVVVDVETAIKEIEELENGKPKEKALKTLNRIQPHIINLDNYMQGRKSDGSK